MNFTLDTEVLKEAMELIGRTLPKKAVKPALEGVKIYSGTEGINIEATDMEVSSRVFVRPEKMNDIEGFVLEGKTLYNLTQKLKGETVKFSIKENKVVIKADSGQLTLPKMSVDEFPPINLKVQGDSLTLSRTDFVEGLRKVMPYASSDELQRNLAGVHLDFLNEESMRVVAADGFRLSYFEMPYEVPSDSTLQNMTIPLKAAREIKRIADSVKDENITLVSDGKRIKLEFGGKTIVVRLIEASFPDYRPILSKGNESQTVMKINKQHLLDSVDMLRVLSQEIGDTLVFEIKDNQTVLSAITKERGQGESELSAEVDGGDLKAAFDPVFINQALKTVESEDALLEFRGDNNPLVVREPDGSNYMAIIMPVKMRDAA